MNAAPGDWSGHSACSRRRFGFCLGAALLLAAVCVDAGAGAADRERNPGLEYHVLRGDVAAVQALLTAGADPNLKGSDSTGGTVLMAAASLGHVDIIRALLAAGARVNAKNREGWSALLHAADRGHTEAVKVLLAAKAEPDTSVVMLGGGRTPLMLALSTGNVEMARALLEARASVYVSTSYGATALRFATWHDTPAMRQLVREMLAAGAEVDAGRRPSPPSTVNPLTSRQALTDVVRTMRHAEGTALGDIATRGSAEMAQILLSAGARVDVRQIDWKTPLMLAAAGGNEPVVRLLLEAGADVHARDGANRTALDLAIARERHDIVPLLRSAATTAPRTSAP